MFEQKSYNRESVRHELPGADLFRNYEVKNWNFSPRLYKILGISVIFNVLFLTVFAQGNLLTRRGCDSPFARTICQVVDTVYVGAILATTDREYVDAAYDQIDLGDAEITYIDVSGETPPLSYPEGYFQIANPVQYAMMQEQQAADPNNSGNNYIEGFPGLTPTRSYNDLMNTPPVTPSPNPDALQGDLKSPFKIEGNPTITRPRGGRIKKGSNANTGETDFDESFADVNTKPADETVKPVETAPEVKKTDPITGVDINKRPVVDLGNYVNGLLEKKVVNLETEFLVQAKGKLDKDGRLDPKTFKYEKIVSTDENMKEVLKQSIEAINVAGYLQYLKDLSGKDFNLLLQQDAENISAVVQSELETETRARSIKSGLDVLIGLAKTQKTSETADQNDKDDLLLLENAKVETDGKKVIIHFRVPKKLAHPMIQRKLAEQAAEAQKPNGNAQVKPTENTAKK